MPLLNGSLEVFDGGDYYLYDAFNPAARNATFQGFMEGYGKYDIRRIWLDASEPERFDVPDVGNWRYTGGSDGEIGEAWIREHVRGFADGMASIGVSPDDYFVLPRHAWVGTWRYSAGLWSGDIQSQFSELALQVRALQVRPRSCGRIWR